MQKELERIIKLAPKEMEDFSCLIKRQRKLLISSPKDTAKKAMLYNQDNISTLLQAKKVSQVIHDLRELSYNQFLIEESKFNAIVLSNISKDMQIPRLILQKISKELYNYQSCSLEEFQEKIRCSFGKFAGSISPYIYQLCLSNTQSRRSRAGKVFEGIIYFLYEYYNYQYESQAKIGKKMFSSLGVGKVVDSVLPSTKAFIKFRNKTIVGSMKTTLRERWQEVVEEISRSNLPNIYLLTVDDNISFSKAKQMSEHNIVLVVQKTVKAKNLLDKMHNVIDFETYFLKEIPQLMNYWKQYND